ncbi:MAG: hypothetical protein D3906_12250, partial [Candidatus Electrothrix sp. AUS1_2]|nr:hypothetical protein [Candidatus Electrothrix sp. AUS1_2]
MRSSAHPIRFNPPLCSLFIHCLMKFCRGFSTSSFVPACLLFFVAALPLLVPARGEAKPLPDVIVQDGQPINLQQEKYRKLFLELEQKYNFQPTELEQIFQGQKIAGQVLDLMDKQWKRRPYYEYFRLFLTPKTISTGK